MKKTQSLAFASIAPVKTFGSLSRRLVAGLAAIAVIGAVESVPAADQKPAERRTVRLPGVLVDNAS